MSVTINVSLSTLPDLVEVGAASRAVRHAEGISLREAAKQSGVSFNTLSRIERGVNGCTYSSVVAVLRWMEGKRVA